MQNENRKFLEFNGKNKNVLSKNGLSYVAIKPIMPVTWIRLRSGVGIN